MVSKSKVTLLGARAGTVLLTLCVILFGEAHAQSNCLGISASGARELTAAIATKIKNLESNGATVREKPSVLLVFRGDWKPIISQSIRAKHRDDIGVLEDAGCVDREDIESNIRSSSVPNLRFTSATSDKFSEEVLKRIRQIGPDQMDPVTANAFRAVDVNYVVSIKGAASPVEYKCTFNYQFVFQFDVHSSETREVVSGRLTANGNYQQPSKYLNISSKTTGPRGALITSLSTAPICIGKTEITLEGSVLDPSWEEEIKCIAPGSKHLIRHALSEPVVGNGYFELKSACDKFFMSEFPLAASFPATGAGSTSGTSQPSGFPPSGGLPSGTVILPCGCHGGAIFGQTFPWAQCKSGVAVSLSCNAPCPLGGFSWGNRCT